ncbi:MAG: right-handed parallel beta-helix repeat-containing protein [Verrucomicrobiia bacterium]
MNTRISHWAQLGLVGAGLLALGCTYKCRALDLHVAPDGSDSWSGRRGSPDVRRTDGPFASLERARDSVRELRREGALTNETVLITVHGGLYSRERAFQLNAEDSGTPEAPVVYRAEPGKEVRLIGGKVVNAFNVVTDADVLDRLDPAARGKVVSADLRALGISDYGSPAGGGLELFFADKPMRIARWPNEGFVRITKVLGTTPVDVRGTKGCAEGIFIFGGDRLAKWSGEKDIWVHGYWFWDWSDQRQKVKAIDASKQTIEIAPPYHSYGYRQGQWFYAYNLLSELDQPGEWYLDRDAGVLYFWPPDSLEGNRVIVSVLPALVNAEGASHVRIHGLVFEAARETALTISGGAGNRVVGCTIRNVGGSAISISGGSDHGVISCDVYQCGAGGISLGGGNRKTLEPAGHFADNNHIHHYGRWRPMYSAGLSLSGVGQRATHNLIDNAPHQAISFGGNDHLMEFNEIHSVCFESNDAGAIYSGRDWTMRGTVIRHNYLHDITGFEGRGCVGVYLDDMYCGTDIIGNVFYRVTRAAFIGGGRDCRVENNVFVECKPAVHVDARAMGWAKYHADDWVKEGKEKGTLSGTDYQKPPYSERYPGLVNILDDNPWAPKGNVIARNICVGGRWDEIESKARPMITFKDNLLNEDPRFIDAPRQNFQLRPDSPAFRAGFERIPIEKIGVYRDSNRAVWPVESTVRPEASASAK